MGYILSKTITIPDFYHYYVILYHSSFTLLMGGVLRIGFTLASCIPSFHHRFLWIATLGCLLDTIVTSILANTGTFLMKNHTMELFYKMIPILLKFYTFGRVQISYYACEQKEELSSQKNVCYIFTVIIHLILWFPLMLVIVMFVFWLNLMAVFSLYKIFFSIL